jgi:hypothetical protein
MLMPSASIEITATFFSNLSLFAISYLLLTLMYYKYTLESTSIYVIPHLIMKKAGRPKVPKNKALAPGISVRLSPAERETIESAIKASGLSQSKWARKGLIYVATHDIRIT